MRVFPVFCHNEEEAQCCRRESRLRACPKCGQAGDVVCHGLLLGYRDGEHRRVVRGWRFWCSDRGRRRGCGKTFSVLWSWALRCCTVSANLLWLFVSAVGEGKTVKAGWEMVSGKLSLRTGYRLWGRLLRVQSWVRQLLLREKPPPASEHRRVEFELIDHLGAVFGGAVCPVCEFQRRFQRNFLGP